MVRQIGYGQFLPFAVSPLYGTSNSLRPIPFFQFIIRSPTVSKVSTTVLIKRANKMHYRCTISQLYFSKTFWEIVHLVRFYYKNVSRCTVFWISNLSTIDSSPSRSLCHWSNRALSMLLERRWAPAPAWAPWRKGNICTCLE